MYLIKFQRLCILTFTSDLISPPPLPHHCCQNTLAAKCLLLCIIEVFSSQDCKSGLGCYCTGGGQRLKEHGETPTVTGVWKANSVVLCHGALRMSLEALPTFPRSELEGKILLIQSGFPKSRNVRLCRSWRELANNQGWKGFLMISIFWAVHSSAHGSIWLKHLSLNACWPKHVHVSWCYPSETGLSSVFYSHAGAKKKIICSVYRWFSFHWKWKSQVVCCIADEWLGCAGFGVQAKESLTRIFGWVLSSKIFQIWELRTNHCWILELVTTAIRHSQCWNPCTTTPVYTGSGLNLEY